MLRGFRNTGPYIRVIFKMIVDIIHFMGILSVFILGFSQSFFTLLYNVPEFIDPAKSILSTFDMIIENFDFPNIVENTDYKLTAEYIYRIYLVVAIIILLNMLIAILENSYTKIIEKANKEWQLEKKRN